MSQYTEVGLYDEARQQLRAGLHEKDDEFVLEAFRGYEEAGLTFRAECKEEFAIFKRIFQDSDFYAEISKNVDLDVRFAVRNKLLSNLPNHDGEFISKYLQHYRFVGLEKESKGCVK